jgi:hypothetical protein
MNIKYNCKFVNFSPQGLKTEHCKAQDFELTGCKHSLNLAVLYMEFINPGSIHYRCNLYFNNKHVVGNLTTLFQV